MTETNETTEDGGVIAVRYAALAIVVIGIAIIAHSNRL